ncbi:TPA: phage protease [Enterobacter roggenkampii]|uniref:phage protease n=1 Tax=Enterobacteriaceae TaxID=543 RepID=UPI00193E6523|nr:phage protease [Lelliottia sp. RWM.1]MBM3072348.1 peptidase [Lelliottia sp. RWM.1]
MNTTQPELLALCFELPDLEDASQPLPEWLPMIPAGIFTGRDGRSWINNNPDAVVSASFRYPKLPFDAEHSTELLGPKGEEAPAYAWIDALRVNADGSIDGHIEWTPDGEVLVRGKKYRYYSPAFFNTADAQVTRLSSAGLTNKPNLFLPALNSENHEMTVPVQIVTVLGLAATASVEDVVKGIQQIKDRETVALNRAENPDLSKFIPVETHQLALNRAETAEGRLKVLDDKTATDMVDGAVTAGKVAPANRDMYLALCRTEDGRKQFNEFVKTAPVLVNADPTKGKENKGQAELTETELAMCRSMGLSKEEFIAAKPKQEQ